MPIQAAILAGGEGTRMRSFSETPKVLLPVEGKPILAHQLEWLKKSGFSEVFLCLGYQVPTGRAAQLEDACPGQWLRLHSEQRRHRLEPAGMCRTVGRLDVGDVVVGVQPFRGHEWFRGTSRTTSRC